ncbi:MoaD/ThiS family protein [Glaciibacter psychrotolerans]|uniref:Molybdopterin synthase sulfur carrier subunit n=1 Tax=Glaciibacter psychrotolerans TaxID=670054 RepID=A0A7Z0J7J9_9MICO|nr:molybdopterin converting factor small subunit [Leifsonia psychrotolerans]
MTRVRYFAGAAEATGTESEHLDVSTLADLRLMILERHGSAFERVLGRCSLLLNGTLTEDPGTALSEGDTVDVLPPFAGG